MSNLNIINNLKIKNQFVKNSNNKLNINHGLMITLLNIFYGFTLTTNSTIRTSNENGKLIKIDYTKKINMKENKDTIQFKNQIKDDILYYINNDKIKNNSKEKNYINKQIDFVIHILETFIKELVNLSTEEKYEYSKSPIIIPENIQKKDHDFNDSEKLKLELLELYSNKTSYTRTNYSDDFIYFNLVNTESLLYNVIKNILHTNNNNINKLFDINDLLKISIGTFFLSKQSINDKNYISISIFMNILRYVKDYVFTIYLHQNNNFRYFLKELNLIKNNKIAFHHLNLNNFEDIYILYKKMFEKTNSNQHNLNNNSYNDNNNGNNSHSSSNENKNNSIINYKNKTYTQNIPTNNSSNNEKISKYCNNVYFISGHGGMYDNTLYLMRKPYTLSFINDLNSYGILNYDNIIMSSFINKKNETMTFKNIDDAKNYYYGMFVPYQNFKLEFIENIKNTECHRDNKWLYSGIIRLKDVFQRFDKSLNKEESSNFCFYNNTKFLNKIIKRNYSFSGIKENKTKENNLKKIIYKFNDKNIISNYYLMVNNELNLDELVYFISKSKSVQENSRFIFNSCRKFSQNTNKITQINNNLSNFVNKITEIHNIISTKSNPNNQSNPINPNNKKNQRNNVSISSSSIRLKSGNKSMYNIFDIIKYIKNTFLISNNSVTQNNNLNSINNSNIYITNNMIQKSLDNKLSKEKIYTLIKFIDDVSNDCIYKFDLIKVNNSLDIILELLQK